jgi:hypothetical protein
VTRTLVTLIIIVYLPCISYCQDNEESGGNVFKIFKSKAEVDSMTQGYIYWKDLIKAGKIDLKGCENCKVTGFDLHVIAYKVYNSSDSGSVDPRLSGRFHSDSAEFSTKMIKAIRRAKEGTVKFSNIFAITPAKQEIKLNEVVLYLYPERDYYKKKVVTFMY